MRSFSLVGNQVCFFSSDLRRQGLSTLTAVDAVHGETSWKQVFDGDPSSQIHQAGDLLTFLTRYPARLHAYDTETGLPVQKTSLNSGGVLRKILVASPQRVVIHSPHRFLEAWSLVDGNRSWVVNLDFFSSPHPVPTGNSISIFAKRKGRNLTLAARIDKKNGKIRSTGGSALRRRPAVCSAGKGPNLFSVR